MFHAALFLEHNCSQNSILRRHNCSAGLATSWHLQAPQHSLAVPQRRRRTSTQQTRHRLQPEARSSPSQQNSPERASSRLPLPPVGQSRSSCPPQTQCRSAAKMYTRVAQSGPQSVPESAAMLEQLWLVQGLAATSGMALKLSPRNTEQSVLETVKRQLKTSPDLPNS